jgi:hypothetical protein
MLGRDDLVLTARKEEDGQVGRKLEEAAPAIPLLVEEPGERGERGRERRNEVGDAGKRVLKNERRGDGRVVGSKIDGDRAADRLAKEDDRTLAEHGMVRQEVERGLGIGLRARAKEGKSVVLPSRACRADPATTALRPGSFAP